MSSLLTIEQIKQQTDKHDSFQQQTLERERALSREAGLSLNSEAWKERFVSAGQTVSHLSPEGLLPTTPTCLHARLLRHQNRLQAELAWPGSVLGWWFLFLSSWSSLTTLSPLERVTEENL